MTLTKKERIDTQLAIMEVFTNAGFGAEQGLNILCELSATFIASCGEESVQANYDIFTENLDLWVDEKLKRFRGLDDGE
jgi:hypothetical protein